MGWNHDIDAIHIHQANEFSKAPAATPDSGSQLLFEDPDTGEKFYATVGDLPGGGALNDLTDVDTTGVADGDVLVYDADTSTWVPGGSSNASYSEKVGDASTTTFEIEHSLDSSAVIVEVIEVSSGAGLVAGTDYTWSVVSNDKIEVVFSSAPGADDALVVVLASGGSAGSGGGPGGGPGNIIERVDTPPSSPNAMDDEFDDDSFNTSLWTDYNIGTATKTETKSALIIAVSENQDQCRGISQPAPAGDWEFMAKIARPWDAGQHMQATMFVSAGTSSTHYECGWWMDGTPSIRALSRTAPSSAASSWGGDDSGTFAPFIYVRMGFSSGTVTFAYSYTGVPGDWRTGMEGPTAGGFSPALVGLGITNRRNGPRTAVFDWFRRVA